MRIKRENYGTTKHGEMTSLFTLSHDDGSYVSLINYGAAVQAIAVPDRRGNPTDVCLGYDSIRGYETAEDFAGATIGRCANRIGNSAFYLNGEIYRLAPNAGPNHLHGGVIGFDKRVFDYKIEENSVVFSYLSADGEEGYPGNLSVSVEFSFTKCHELIISYKAQCDRDTLVSLTNHTYFNLNGEGNGTILDHTLKLDASNYAGIDENCLPDGRILPVCGTPFDFIGGKAVGKDIGASNVQLAYGNGYDHHFILDNMDENYPAAILFSPQSGIEMKVFTTKPGVQLYTGNYIRPAAGKSGIYARRTGLCLETQFFPDAINNPRLPSPILKEGDKYAHMTKYTFC